jgi:hypothetical protein
VLSLSLSPQPEQVNLCISSKEAAAKSSGSCCGSEDPREEEHLRFPPLSVCSMTTGVLTTSAESCFSPFPVC